MIKCALTDHLPTARHEVCTVVVVEDSKKTNGACEVSPSDGQATEWLVQLALKAQTSDGADAGCVPRPSHRQLLGLKKRLTNEPSVVGQLMGS